jgi:hypothetical protein
MPPPLAHIYSGLLCTRGECDCLDRRTESNAARTPLRHQQHRVGQRREYKKIGYRPKQVPPQALISPALSLDEAEATTTTSEIVVKIVLLSLSCYSCTQAHRAQKRWCPLKLLAGNSIPQFPSRSSFLGFVLTTPLSSTSRRRRRRRRPAKSLSGKSANMAGSSTMPTTTSSSSSSWTVGLVRLDCINANYTRDACKILSHKLSRANSGGSPWNPSAGRRHTHTLPRRAPLSLLADASSQHRTDSCS